MRIKPLKEEKDFTKRRKKIIMGCWRKRDE